ncbi:alpha/beta hydrolase [Kribbella sp. NPDC026611]|uniref:alpha/beta fold hydrolase n=1 Tax=Kribbella sp. NPDC026611 TaxID=3154911 RepID=UPI0033CF5535
MGDYIDLNGVQMWYDDSGTGEPLVLLHGGLTDNRDFAGNLDVLADHFRLLMPERRGHGHTPDVPGPFAVDVLADDTAAFIEKLTDGPVRLAGYSAGAVVALRTAVHRPELVERLVLISGAFHPDGMILRPSLDAPPPPPLLAAYAEVSPDGADHFGEVIAKVVRSVEEDRPLTTDELATVTCPALVVAADDDLVSLEHTIAMYRALPASQLAVVPGTSHLLLHEKPADCVRLVREFLTTDAASTLMPIRRGGAG